MDTGGLSYWENALQTGTSMIQVRAGIAGSPEEANAIQAAFQTTLGRAADASEVAAYQQVLGSNGSWTLSLVTKALVPAAINAFYHQLFGRDAMPVEYADKAAALAAGQSLQSQFNYLRPIFATSATETGTINLFYQHIYGRDARAAELTILEANLASGQSLLAL